MDDGRVTMMKIVHASSLYDHGVLARGPTYKRDPQNEHVNINEQTDTTFYLLYPWPYELDVSNLI
ncbi:hypothetical protein HanRHA438_Chr02g0085891 [Helianthus annuus]|nr:hypothetical protein HanRHA438_Chr02g0085891 [Helianthus annuus]